VDSKYRDGLLAIITGGALIGTVAIFNTELDTNIELAKTIFTVRPAAIGIFGMVAIELMCLYDSDRTQTIWNRRSIQFSSIMTVVTVSGLTLMSNIHWVFAALLWGLLAYLVLLIVVIITGENPLSRLTVSRN
jgi:hypothetical protein